MPGLTIDGNGGVLLFGVFLGLFIGHKRVKIFKLT
jgi:hypothetical protein